MEMISIFALSILIAIVVKVLVISISPKSWLKFAERIWKFPSLTMVIALVLAGIVLYYLIQEINIIQIFAVILFVALMSMATLAIYAKEFIPVAKKLINDKKIMKRAWLLIVIWLILAIWVALELYLSFSFSRW